MESYELFLHSSESFRLPLPAPSPKDVAHICGFLYVFCAGASITLSQEHNILNCMFKRERGRERYQTNGEQQ